MTDRTHTVHSTSELKEAWLNAIAEMDMSYCLVHLPGSEEKLYLSRSIGDDRDKVYVCKYDENGKYIDHSEQVVYIPETGLVVSFEKANIKEERSKR